MNEQDPQNILETARSLIKMGVPSPPYWEGRTFDDLLNIPRDRACTSEEWDEIIAQFVRLLECEEFQVCENAIARLEKALRSESSSADGLPQQLQERLNLVFDAIAARSRATPKIFEVFCDNFKRDGEPYSDLILQWLDRSNGLTICQR
jgi:hypothetical protein